MSGANAANVIDVSGHGNIGGRRCHQRHYECLQVVHWFNARSMMLTSSSEPTEQELAAGCGIWILPSKCHAILEIAWCRAESMVMVTRYAVLSEAAALTMRANRRSFLRFGWCFLIGAVGNGLAGA